MLTETIITANLLPVPLHSYVLFFPTHTLKSNIEGMRIFIFLFLLGISLLLWLPFSPDNTSSFKGYSFLFYVYKSFPSRYVCSEDRREFRIWIWNRSYRFLLIHHVGAKSWALVPWKMVNALNHGATFIVPPHPLLWCLICDRGLQCHGFKIFSSFTFNLPCFYV